jgi:O-methyltransferase involved in polyketide biosynthesis
MSPQKDFSSVSPSARSLLLMKAYTDIPFAHEAAKMVQGPEVFGLDFENKDFWFWIRVLHFEARYRSVDQLMAQAMGSNILELSSGYSFRGLDLCRREEVHYIDTDLPDVVQLKKQMIESLPVAMLRGHLETLPLNVMDESAFADVVARFAPGPLTIVNEGLLMYLNTDEKKALCSTIRKVLQARGGCWITADIYVQRSEQMRASLPQSNQESAFFEQHRIEENKFASYEAAEAFFKEQGFHLVSEADVNIRELSVVPHLMNVMPDEVRNSTEPPPKVQATWMLRVDQ